MEKCARSKPAVAIGARLVFPLLFCLPTFAVAQTYTVLNDFRISPGNPLAPLIQGADGGLYGTTSIGGAGGRGTVFKMDMSGHLTTLHDFAGIDGNGPAARLIQASDGTFYGTTVHGGSGACSDGCGTVFTIESSGTLTTLHEFTGADGWAPSAGLLEAADGAFYGTTSNGGANGHGTIFRMDSSGNLTTLHSFEGSDGSAPMATLIEATDGHLYGTTYSGGSADQGTVFQITSSGTLTSLHSFTGSDGSTPVSGLLQSPDGTFYGTTLVGGPEGLGTVFRMTPLGDITTLHSFTGTPADGAGPMSDLIRGADGAFYGTTETGGSVGLGTIFRMDSSGNTTTLHGFTGGDGSEPSAGLVQTNDGFFYGTTPYGGTGIYGTVFKMNPSGDFSTVHDFMGSEGYQPFTKLTQGSDGTFYGTTYLGGMENYGTLFRMDFEGNVTTVHSFTDSDGSTPSSPLIEATDGNFYGTTLQGGASLCGLPLIHGCGTIFKRDPSGMLTMLHSFGGGDGYMPAGDLVQANDGSLYGTTLSGGGGTCWSGCGTVFKVDQLGHVTTLHNFAGSGGLDGASPFGLIQATDTFFYGTTGQAGQYGDGTIFRMDPSGTLTTLHSFDGSDGSTPGFILQAVDGFIYGSTSGGGAHGLGTIFVMDSTGIVTTLHSFAGSDGAGAANLIQATDGRLFGTTSQGGQYGQGTIFGMDPSGNVTVLYSFAGTDGTSPTGLIQATDGQLYGTTFQGGAAGVGVVFRLGLCLPPTASSNSPVCPGQTIQLFAFPSAGATYSWTGPNGFASTLQAPTVPDVTAADAGTYTVTVTAGDCSSAQASVEVVVNPGVPPAPVITSSHCVLPNTPGLTASVPANAGDTYGWTIAGGTITSGQATASITFTSGDVGIGVRLSVIESNGTCSGADAKIVQVDFADMPASNPFHDFICRIAENGITVGCGAGSFCPADDVLRSQMAVFLLRGEHGLAYLPPAATGLFGDVPASNPFAPWIEELYNEGITSGCSTNPLMFCPNNDVSRAGMAVFLLVAEHGTGYAPPACAGVFTDVACPSPFADWIEELYNEGVTGGCNTNPLQYCPGNSVTRAQMAVFLTATFNLP